MLTATVLPDVTGLDKTFDYLVPDELAAQVVVGSLVRVPLHGRRVGGWVLRVGDPDPDVSVDRLVPIARWSGIGPAPEIVELAAWAAHRWGAARLRPLLVSASPPRSVRSLPAQRRTVGDRSAGANGPAGAAGAAGATRLLADGGGVLRVTPASDPLALVLDVARHGPILVVHPSVGVAREIAAGCRRAGLSTAVVPEEWAAAAGGVDVVIGGRSAAWAPIARAAVFVVLDEHDGGLQEERTPTWHARDVLIERARRSGAPVLLVSPCPTVDALAWSGRRWMRPAPGDERDGWPIVDVVDRGDDEPWRRSLVTSPLIAALRDHDRRVVVVHNTPGRARLLACRACRSTLVCERCAAAVHQRDDGVLACRRCGSERPPACQRCGSSALANVRPGVSRLREELAAAANRDVVAVTGSSTGPEADPDRLESVGVLVGTEAVLHRVGSADVVAFVDLDAELLAPRYRAAEQTFALLVRAARLLGPRARGGRMILQTWIPTHEVIEAALHADPGRLARAEAARRRDLGLPPFGALAAVSGAGAPAFVDALEVAVAAGRAAAAVAPDGSGGFLVRASDPDELAAALATVERPRGSRVRVEVDPPRR